VIRRLVLIGHNDLDLAHHLDTDTLTGVATIEAQATQNPRR
jgi:hypothetical protein